jgi:hypothetical protein
MTESKVEHFNTQPLLIEIENVIKSGLNSILTDFLYRYNLLEKTHNKIMNLPSVRSELNKPINSDSDTESGSGSPKIEENITSDVKGIVQGLVREKMCDVETKLNALEKKYDAVLPILDKILNKLQLLNDDVKVLKQSSSENKVGGQTSSPVIKASIVSACENENIQFDIKENERVINENEKADTQVASLPVASLPVASLEEEEEEAEEESVASLEEEESVASLPVASLEEVETEASDEEEEDSEASDEEEEEDSDARVEEDEDPVATVEEEEEEEVTEIEIDDVTYFTNDDENGFIYEATEDEEVGDKVGYFKDGEPFFYADEK